MIRIKPETPAKKSKIGVTHAPYAFTRKVIPEVMYGDKPVTKKPKTAKAKPHNIVTRRNTPEKGGDRRTGSVAIHAPSSHTRVATVEETDKHAVTKRRKFTQERRTGKVKAPSPPPAPVSSAGRPKVHATAADRQRAYRERQKEAKA